MVCQPRTKNQRRNQVQMKLDVSSLAHTKWECKYHIVFAPKYRRQIIYEKIKQDIGQMLRKLCEYKDIEIHEAEACKDHIHMLVAEDCGQIKCRYDAEVHKFLTYFFESISGRGSILQSRNTQQLIHGYSRRKRADGYCPP